MTTTPVPTCTDDLLAAIERATSAEYLTEGKWKSSTDDGNGESPIVYVDIPGGVSVLFESDWATQTDAELVALCSPANIRALLARLHASEEEIGRRNAFQHEQMTFFTIPILRFAAEVGITDGAPKEKVQALIERMHAAEKDAGRWRKACLSAEELGESGVCVSAYQYDHSSRQHEFLVLTEQEAAREIDAAMEASK